MCKIIKVFFASTLLITGTIMKDDFFSTNTFKNSIELHTLNVQTNEHCMNNIVKISLDDFEFPMNKIQILNTHSGRKL